MLRFGDYPQHVRQLMEAAVRGGEPGMLVCRQLRREGSWVQLPALTHSLQHGKLYLIAVGKAAIPMGKAALELLGEGVAAGVLVSKTPPPADLPSIMRCFQAGHPLPNVESVRAGIAVANLLRQTTAEDLVLCLISGGTSALLTHPRLPLAMWQEINQTLLRAGCSINEVNQVRQWFDLLKGGGLARLAAPATVVSLILSDVIGNELAHIGSGPTVKGMQNAGTVQAILHRYPIFAHLSPPTQQIVQQLLEQPAKEDAAPVYWGRVHNHLIGDVGLAAQAAAQQAAALGFQPVVLTTYLTGEAREVGKVVAALVKGASAGTALILGGETTVTVTGNGLGGRNQELALSAALSLHGWENRVVASFATDGEDGVTPVAGAMVTGRSITHATVQNLDPYHYLAHNDSYTFFHHLMPNGLLTTVQSTNVNDLVLGLVYETPMRSEK